MRKLASIRRISGFEEIPEADVIVLAIVDGWRVIVRKEENYQVGDLIVYVEPDSIMPESANEVLEFSNGRSLLYDTAREGIVFRNYDLGVSFKAISPQFLVEHSL